jgi:antitoxin component YwqK of YwqJK toxin-antitoxin module
MLLFFRLFPVLASCFFLFPVFAQQGQEINQIDAQGRKHGTYRKMGVEGKVRYEGYFEHGIAKGTFRHFYDDGQLMAENISRAGKKAALFFIIREV